MNVGVRHLQALPPFTTPGYTDAMTETQTETLARLRADLAEAVASHRRNRKTLAATITKAILALEAQTQTKDPS